jgi:hypothetical protein
VGLQGMENQTFYINGRAPPFSTPKPIRFICVRRDDGLQNVPMSQLTWGQCHNYPNWTGPSTCCSASWRGVMICAFSRLAPHFLSQCSLSFFSSSQSKFRRFARLVLKTAYCVVSCVFHVKNENLTLLFISSPSSYPTP